MHRSTFAYPLILALVPLAACVAPSRSLGAGESTGDDGSGSATLDTTGTSDTDGDPVCPQTDSFSCTVPYDGMSLGACGGFDFDENCCMRESCSGIEDCDEGEACVAFGSGGLGCSDAVVDGQTICECGANAGGFPRRVCLPIDEVPVDWCSGAYDEASCNDNAPIERGPNDVQFCQWIDVQLLIDDPETMTCVFGETEPRCLTIQQGFDPGCAAVPCALGPDPLVLANAYARTIGGGPTIEVFGVDDVFCGSGFPLGDWARADDPSFGACAFSCGYGNPCATPFPEYVVERSEASKDAPVDDCGFVTADDDVAAWQAARDCALGHAAAGQGFRLIAQGPSIDSVVQDAYLGLQGESYGATRLRADDGLGAYSLFEQAGAGWVAVEACEVAVGELCLDLEAAGDNVQICPA